MTTISQPSYEAVHAVALNMRERDFAEFSAVTPARTREELADLLTARYFNQEHTLCASLHGEPVAIGAAVEMRPNVLSLLLFATDKFPAIATGLTKFIVKRLFPPLVAAGVHRIEAVALEGYVETHRWLGVLGLSPETGALQKYGKNGEDFRLFSWVKDARTPSA